MPRSVGGSCAQRTRRGGSWSQRSATSGSWTHSLGDEQFTMGTAVTVGQSVAPPCPYCTGRNAPFLPTATAIDDRSGGTSVYEASLISSERTSASSVSTRERRRRSLRLLKSAGKGVRNLLRRRSSSRRLSRHLHHQDGIFLEREIYRTIQSNFPTSPMQRQSHRRVHFQDSTEQSTSRVHVQDPIDVSASRVHFQDPVEESTFSSNDSDCPPSLTARIRSYPSDSRDEKAFERDARQWSDSLGDPNEVRPGAYRISGTDNQSSRACRLTRIGSGSDRNKAVSEESYEEAQSKNEEGEPQKTQEADGELKPPSTKARLTDSIDTPSKTPPSSSVDQTSSTRKPSSTVAEFFDYESHQDTDSFQDKDINKRVAERPLSRPDTSTMDGDCELSMNVDEEGTTTDVAILPEDEINQVVAARYQAECTILPVPLSLAAVHDTVVYNDTLKVVMLSSNAMQRSRLAWALQGGALPPQQRSALGVDIIPWTPSSTVDTSTLEHLKIMIWDVHGATGGNGIDFSLHTGTQSLFFSPSSLYVLVWDMAFSNPRTYLLEDDDSLDNHDALEEANLQADITLQNNIGERVLPWVDCVSTKPKAVILPVAMVAEGMTDSEVNRRCTMLRKLLEEHVNRLASDGSAPRLLMGDAQVPCIRYDDNAGVKCLREMILTAASGRSSVFDHVGARVPPGTVRILQAIRRFRQDNLKVIELKMLLYELGDFFQIVEVTHALRFLSSIGEIMYFGDDGAGNENDTLLSRYIVLCKRWMVSALSCVLKDDLKAGLAVARHMVNELGITESGQQAATNEICEALVGNNASHCPVLPSTDAEQLWIYKRFMKVAAERCCHAVDGDGRGTSMTLFRFLERVLVRAGVFFPLDVGLHQSLNQSDVFFIPGCLTEPTSLGEIWTYKTKDSWKTTLCHLWPLQGHVPSGFMEQVIVSLLRDLTEFLTSVQNSSETVDDSSFTSATSSLQKPIRIHQVMSWKSCFTAKLGMLFEDKDSQETRESFVDIFVSLMDQTSSHCVASNSFGASSKHLIISGKGEGAYHARKLWMGGYRTVLDSVVATMTRCTKLSSLDCKVACPECLKHGDPRDACSWSYYSISEVAKTAHPVVCCAHGHCEDSHLLCGTLDSRESWNEADSIILKPVKRAFDIFPSVVMIGVWNPDMKKLCCVGSGFVVDSDLGLVITAAHNLFCLNAGSQFGCRFTGTVVIGMIPKGQDRAQFSHVAEIVADGISNHVDGCVLRIRDRILDDKGGGVGELGTILGGGTSLPDEMIPSLTMTTFFQVEESVRIIGFNQGGEGGVFERLHSVDPFVDCAKGYIRKFFNSGEMINNGGVSLALEPRKEIVIDWCRTIVGQSGGPCVNDKGEVVGILSRSDPDDPNRCYVVPSIELKRLLMTAKSLCT